MLFGAQRLYRFAHGNPQLRLCRASYAHAASTLAQLRRPSGLSDSGTTALHERVGEPAGGLR
jgi:hypothetical protein